MTTTYQPRTIDADNETLGVGTIGLDIYAVRCERPESGARVVRFRKWDGSESVVVVPRVGSRFRCSCKGHLLGGKCCRHIQFVARHGMEIDPIGDVETVRDLDAEAAEMDSYYAGAM